MPGKRQERGGLTCSTNGVAAAVLPASRLRSGAARLADVGAPFCQGWRWLPSAAVVGGLPFLLSWWWGGAWHQAASAILLTVLCLACVKRDAWVKGIAAISVAYVVHCALVVALAAVSPERAAALLPGAEDYWHKQLTWIQTGQDPEYQLSAWVPAHFHLLGGTVLYSCTSLGGLAFFEGFREVDLMNYYNAQLLQHSRSQFQAVSLGWHAWSVLRGIGYAFIIFEAVSLSLQAIVGVRISQWRLRWRRWQVGLAFFVADGLVKFTMLEPVRSHLASNLR